MANPVSGPYDGTITQATCENEPTRPPKERPLSKEVGGIAFVAWHKRSFNMVVLEKMLVWLHMQRMSAFASGSLAAA